MGSTGITESWRNIGTCFSSVSWSQSDKGEPESLMLLCRDVLEDYKSERFGDWAYGADEAWTQYYASFSILKGFGIRVPIMGVIGEVSATLADETEVLFQAYVARLEV